MAIKIARTAALSLAVVMLLCTALSAPAQATVNKPYDVKCDFAPENATAYGGCAVSGRIARGHFVGYANVTIKSISQLTVYDIDANRTDNYTDAEISMANGSALWQNNHTMSISGSADGVIIYMIQDNEVFCAIAGSGGKMELSGALEDDMFMPQGSMVHVKGAGGTSATYNASGTYTFKITGNVSVSESAAAYMMPASGISISFSPSKSGVADLGKLMESMTKLMGGAGGGGNGAGAGMSMPRLETFNGAIFGPLNGNITIDNVKKPVSGDINVLRFESAKFTMAGDRLLAEGKCKFAMFGGAVYHKTDALKIYGFELPLLAIYMWIGAVGAIFASLFARSMIKGVSFASMFKKKDEKEKEQEKQKEKEKLDLKSDLNDLLKLPALVAHLVLFFLSFYLFDQEYKYILGVGLFESIGGLASGINLSNLGAMIGLLFAVFMPISWAFMALFFGAPMKVILSSVFRVFGFAKGARGISKGLGSLLGTYLIGSTFITWLLALILPMIFGLIMGNMGGGAG